MTYCERSGFVEPADEDMTRALFSPPTAIGSPCDDVWRSLDYIELDLLNLDAI